METRCNNSSSLTANFTCCCGVSEEEFQASATTPVFIFLCIVLVLTSIFAVVGNSLVLASIWRTPSLHSPSNVLIVGLAVSDLCVGLLVEPMYGLAQHIGSAHVFCYAAVLVWLSGILLTLTSLITVTAISVDFYLALHLHLRYKELVTVGRMVRVLVGIWVCAFVATSLNICDLVQDLVSETCGPCLCISSFPVSSGDHYSLFQSVQNCPPSPDTDPEPGTASARACRSRGRRTDEYH